LEVEIDHFGLLCDPFQKMNSRNLVFLYLQKVVTCHVFRLPQYLGAEAQMFAIIDNQNTGLVEYPACMVMHQRPCQI
jgi:hypothetical protein